MLPSPSSWWAFPSTLAHISALRAAAPGGGTNYFRPRAAQSVTHIWFRSDPLPLEPVATVIAREEDDDPSENWVAGVVARNPFYKRPELTGRYGDLSELRLEETEILVCDLGNWHLSEEPRQYGLVGLEWARSSDVVVLRPRAGLGRSAGLGGGPTAAGETGVGE